MDLYKCPRTFGVLLEYPTTVTGFQWGHLLKNGPYTYTVSGGNGRVYDVDLFSDLNL